MPEEQCNSGSIEIISTEPGINLSNQIICYDYTSADQLLFNPNIITAPVSDCTDTFWTYTVDLDADSIDSPLPFNIQVSAASVSKLVEWDHIHGSTPGLDASSNFYGTYKIRVMGVIPSGNTFIQ